MTLAAVSSLRGTSESRSPRSKLTRSFGEDVSCATGGAGYPFGSRHINVKERFATAFGLRRGVGMSRARTEAGLPLEGRHHRGDDDAWNIAAIVVELARRGQPITA